MKRLRFLIASLLALFAGSRPVHALSCAPMADHYVLVCSSSHCTPAFRAVETSAYEMCARTMTIEPFPEWAAATIVEIVAASTALSQKPLVTVVELSPPYVAPRTERELREALRLWPEHRVAQHAETLDEVRGRYVHRSEASIRTVRGRMVLLILAAIALLVALFGTSVWLAGGLKQRPWATCRGMLFHALLVRVGLFVVGAGSIGSPGAPVPLMLLAPLAVFFALLDVAMYFDARSRRT